MTVQEIIDALMKIEDKSITPVHPVLVNGLRKFRPFESVQPGILADQVTPCVIFK